MLPDRSALGHEWRGQQDAGGDVAQCCSKSVSPNFPLGETCVPLAGCQNRTGLSSAETSVARTKVKSAQLIGASEVQACLEGRGHLPLHLEMSQSASTAQRYHISCLRASSRRWVSFEHVTRCVSGCFEYWRKIWRVPAACGLIFRECGWVAIGRNAHLSERWLNTDTSQHHYQANETAVVSLSRKSTDDGLRGALTQASAVHGMVSALAITDKKRPFDYEETLLDNPQLQMFFASNPSKFHPKVTPFPCIQNPYQTDELERFLESQQAWSGTDSMRIPYSRRIPYSSTLLLCTCCDDEDHMKGASTHNMMDIPTRSARAERGQLRRLERNEKARILRANGFDCKPGRMAPREYVRSVASSQFLWAPFGNGDNEIKWWEAAVLDTIILTDESETLKPLLAGVPSVMVRDWEAVTPASLQKAALHIERRRRNGRFDHMKTLFPQWLFRLKQGTGDMTDHSDGMPMAPPLVLSAGNAHQPKRHDLSESDGKVDRRSRLSALERTLAQRSHDVGSMPQVQQAEARMMKWRPVLEDTRLITNGVYHRIIDSFMTGTRKLVVIPTAPEAAIEHGTRPCVARCNTFSACQFWTWRNGSCFIYGCLECTGPSPMPITVHDAGVFSGFKAPFDESGDVEAFTSAFMQCAVEARKQRADTPTASVGNAIRCVDDRRQQHRKAALASGSFSAETHAETPASCASDTTRRRVAMCIGGEVRSFTLPIVHASMYENLILPMRSWAAHGGPAEDEANPSLVMFAYLKMKQTSTWIGGGSSSGPTKGRSASTTPLGLLASNVLALLVKLGVNPSHIKLRNTTVAAAPEEYCHKDAAVDSTATRDLPCFDYNRRIPRPCNMKTPLARASFFGQLENHQMCYSMITAEEAREQDAAREGYSSDTVTTINRRSIPGFGFILYVRPDLLWYRMLRPCVDLMAHGRSLHARDWMIWLQRESAEAVLDKPYRAVYECRTPPFMPINFCDVDKVHYDVWHAAGVLPLPDLGVKIFRSGTQLSYSMPVLPSQVIRYLRRFEIPAESYTRGVSSRGGSTRPISLIAAPASERLQRRVGFDHAKALQRPSHPRQVSDMEIDVEDAPPLGKPKEGPSETLNLGVRPRLLSETPTGSRPLASSGPSHFHRRASVSHELQKQHAVDSCSERCASSNASKNAESIAHRDQRRVAAMQANRECIHKSNRDSSSPHFLSVAVSIAAYQNATYVSQHVDHTLQHLSLHSVVAIHLSATTDYGTSYGGKLRAVELAWLYQQPRVHVNPKRIFTRRGFGSVLLAHLLNIQLLEAHANETWRPALPEFTMLMSSNMWLVRPGVERYISCHVSSLRFSYPTAWCAAEPPACKSVQHARGPLCRSSQLRASLWFRHIVGQRLYARCNHEGQFHPTSTFLRLARHVEVFSRESGMILADEAGLWEETLLTSFAASDLAESNPPMEYMEDNGRCLEMHTARCLPLCMFDPHSPVNRSDLNRWLHAEQTLIKDIASGMYEGVFAYKKVVSFKSSIGSDDWAHIATKVMAESALALTSVGIKADKLQIAAKSTALRTTSPDLTAYGDDYVALNDATRDLLHVGLQPSTAVRVFIQYMPSYNERDGHVTTGISKEMLIYMYAPVISSLLALLRAAGCKPMLSHATRHEDGEGIESLGHGDIFIWVGSAGAQFGHIYMTPSKWHALRARGVRTVYYQSEPRSKCIYDNSIVDELWDFSWYNIDVCRNHTSAHMLPVLRYVPIVALQGAPNVAWELNRTAHSLLFFGGDYHRDECLGYMFAQLSTRFQAQFRMLYNIWSNSDFEELLKQPDVGIFLNIHKGCSLSTQSSMFPTPVTWRNPVLLNSAALIVSERCYWKDEKAYDGLIDFVTVGHIPYFFHDRLQHASPEYLKAMALHRHKAFVERFAVPVVNLNSGITEMMRNLTRIKALTYHIRIQSPHLKSPTRLVSNVAVCVVGIARSLTSPSVYKAARAFYATKGWDVFGLIDPTSRHDVKRLHISCKYNFSCYSTASLPNNDNSGQLERVALAMQGLQPVQWRFADREAGLPDWMAQHRKLAMCNMMVLQHEKKRGQMYEWIVKTRPDGFPKYVRSVATQDKITLDPLTGGSALRPPNPMHPSDDGFPGGLHAVRNPRATVFVDALWKDAIIFLPRQIVSNFNDLFLRHSRMIEEQLARVSQINGSCDVALSICDDSCKALLPLGERNETGQRRCMFILQRAFFEASARFRYIVMSMLQTSYRLQKTIMFQMVRTQSMCRPGDLCVNDDAVTESSQNESHLSTSSVISRSPIGKEMIVQAQRVYTHSISDSSVSNSNLSSLIGMDSACPCLSITSLFACLRTLAISYDLATNADVLALRGVLIRCKRVFPFLRPPQMEKSLISDSQKQPTPNAAPPPVARIALGYRGEYMRQIYSIKTGTDNKPIGNICSNFFLDGMFTNHRQMLVDPMEASGATVDVFFHTYSAECKSLDRQLVELLAPKAHLFDSHKILNQDPNKTFSSLRLLELIRITWRDSLSSWPSPLDAIVMVRFDVIYAVPITWLNIEWNHLNVAFRDHRSLWERDHKASDLLFIFPMRYLAAFHAALAASCKGQAGHRVVDPFLHGTSKDLSEVHLIDPFRYGTSTIGTRPMESFLGIERSCKGYAGMIHDLCIL